MGKALCDQGDHLLLARGKKRVAVRVDDPQRWDLGDEIDEVVNLLGGGPNLSAVDDLDAFAKQPKGGLAETEQSSGAGPEGIDHQVAVDGFDEQNLRDPRIGDMQAANQSHIVPGTVLGGEGQDQDMRGLGFQGCENDIRVQRTGTYAEFWATAKGGSQQLELHLAGTSQENADGCADGDLRGARSAILHSEAILGIRTPDVMVSRHLIS
jgi:hypothetical protein